MSVMHVDEHVVTLETITPEVAQHYLEGNTHNRNAKTVRIDRYARDMAAGNWRVTGETIKFNGTTLLDGQNRLMACIKADVPFETFVVRGIQPDAMEVIDTGSGRTVGDALKLGGYTNVNVTAAIAKMIICWDIGVTSSGGTQAQQITHLEVIRFVEEHQHLLTRAGLAGGRAYYAINLNSVAVGAAYVKANLMGLEDQFETFLNSTCEGVGLFRGDPRLALRNWVAKTEMRDRWDQLHAILNAWNAMAGWRTLKIIRWTPSADNFPTMASTIVIPHGD